MVTIYFKKYINGVATSVLGILQNICCSDRSPEPQVLHDCRSSDRTNKHSVKIQSHTHTTFFIILTQSEPCYHPNISFIYLEKGD